MMGHVKNDVKTDVFQDTKQPETTKLFLCRPFGGALRISRRWPLPRTSRNPQNPDAQNVAGDRVHTGNILTLVIL